MVSNSAAVVSSRSFWCRYGHGQTSYPNIFTRTMVCPACITGLLIANAPGIAAAAMGTAATVKLAVDRRALLSARRNIKLVKSDVVSVQKDSIPRPLAVVSRDEE